MKLRFNSMLFISTLTIFLVAPIFAFAHPGRTDAYGCHTCRTNCPNWGLSYGEYHCHNVKALPQPEEPIKSKYGEGGTGYTVPAPEYKQPAVQAKPPVTKVESSSTSKDGIGKEQIKTATPTQDHLQEQIKTQAQKGIYNSSNSPKIGFWKGILSWLFGR